MSYATVVMYIRCEAYVHALIHTYIPFIRIGIQCKHTVIQQAFMHTCINTCTHTYLRAYMPTGIQHSRTTCNVCDCMYALHATMYAWLFACMLVLTFAGM